MARSLTLVALLVACQPAFETPTPARRGPSVSLEPDAPLDLAPAVFRLRVAGASAREAPEHLLLFEGILSAYHLGRIRKGDLPKTLLERQVPTLAWTEKRDLVLAPTRRLQPATTYALASPALGWIADLRVDFDAPLRERFWPPPGAPGMASGVVYCSAQPDGVTPTPLRFEPDGPTVAARLGVGAHGVAADRCRELLDDVAVASGPLLPVPLWDGQLVDPAPLLVGPELSAAALACTSPEIAVGPACATVEDDRMVLRAPETLGVALRTPGREVVTRVGAGGYVVVGGLVPSASNRVRGSLFGLSHPRYDVDFTVQALPPLQRVVLNEVMANPLGPEPAQEWVELVNAGGTMVELAGWTLSDGAGEAQLPACSLAPGAFALVVSEAFDESSAADIAIAAGTALLRVPSLGKSGLSNAGEALTLSLPSGQVVSRFPALPKPSKGGRSVARVLPDAIDADPSAFAHHADPGASPGAANTVE